MSEVEINLHTKSVESSKELVSYRRNIEKLRSGEKARHDPYAEELELQILITKARENANQCRSTFTLHNGDKK